MRKDLKNCLIMNTFLLPIIQYTEIVDSYMLFCFLLDNSKQDSHKSIEVCLEILSIKRTSKTKMSD